MPLVLRAFCPGCLQRLGLPVARHALWLQALGPPQCRWGGWASHAAELDWVAGRGPTGLGWNPAPASHPSPWQELIRKGIPHHFRAIVWQLLCSATDMPVKNQYSELLKMSSPCEKLIRRDIARTYPEHEFFKGQDSLGQEVLFNVMKVRPHCAQPWGQSPGGPVLIPACPSRHTLWLTGRWATARAAPSSWACSSCR